MKITFEPGIWHLCWNVGYSSHRWKRLIQKLIKRKTNHWSCHVELRDPSNGLCISSRGFKRPDIAGDVRGGVFWAPIEFSHPERWRIWQLQKIDVDEGVWIRQRAHRILGQKYDWPGAMCRQFARKNRQWCYSAVLWCLGEKACKYYGPWLEKIAREFQPEPWEDTNVNVVS